jgi:hypothetical protein
VSREAKKTAGLWAASLAIDFYTTFVAQNLWNWFVVPALRVPTISFLMMFGLVLLARLNSASSAPPADEYRWKTLFMVLDKCVPEDKMNDLKDAIQEESDGMWAAIGITIFGKLIASTTSLVIGWGVRAFLDTGQ